MKIGFDGKRATTNSTGLGNYSRSLLNQLAQQYSATDFVAYTTKTDKKFKNHILFSHPNLSFRFPRYKWLSWFWRSFQLASVAKKEQVSIFHGLSHELPFFLRSKGIKSVLTVHDLIFLIYPENYKTIDRWIYNFKCKYACQVADLIIAISEQSKADIIKFYGISEEKIKVIYQGCDDQFKVKWSTADLERVRQQYKLPAKFILNVGTIETRKNLLAAVEALNLLDSDIHLVAIGKRTSYYDKVIDRIAELNLTHRVHFYHQLPFSDLPAFYQLAQILVYPSRYEGFGIPIIEALYMQLPVIAATGSCLEEAGGPDSIYVAPDDIQNLAQQIQEVLGKTELKIKMKENGLKFAQKFNSDYVAEQYYACYQNLSNL